VIRRYAVTVGGQERAVELEELEGGVVRATVDGRERRLTVVSSAGSALTWLDGTRVVHVLLDGALPRLTVSLAGMAVPVEVGDARAAVPVAVSRAPAGPVSVRAPIPGRVARVQVKPGDEVPAGGALVVLEAMKMENEIRAPRAGAVSEIRCAEGATVESGQVLVILA
jgi:glutaconyl-CoA/methylmalonyl-CoA decarboxylase subunit gamma